MQKAGLTCLGVVTACSDVAGYVGASLGHILAPLRDG